MENTTIITVLPIGEFDTELIRNEFDTMIAALTHPGVDFIIADPVSDEEGARKSVEKLSKSNPDLLLLIPLRGLSAPVIEEAVRTYRAPCLIWPVQGRFALPSSALAVGALRDAGLIVELVYAPPNNPEVVQNIQSILKTAKTYKQIRQSRIGVIGKLFPNLISCRYDPQTIHKKLGTTILPLPFDEINNTIQEVSGSTDKIDLTRSMITNSYSVNGADMQVLDAGIKLHLALKQIAQEHQLDGYATECWSGFPGKIGLNPCLGFIEDAYMLACEGDVMLCISLLIVRYLTGSSAYVGDLYDLDLEGNLTLVHCGASASLASDPKGVRLVKSQLAHERGFETMNVRPQLAPGLVTIFRFYGQDCDKMHLALGELDGCDLSSNQTVKIKLSGNRSDFLREALGNHYIVVAGDIRKELTLLSKWLGITIFNT